MGLNPNQDFSQRIQVLLEEVRRRERAKAHLWRIRSRSTWMKLSDAPSQYFFKLVQAKRIEESIGKLALADGRITEDEYKILQGVHSH